MLPNALSVDYVFGGLRSFAQNSFAVEEQSDGVIAITTPFEHIYGDPIVVYLVRVTDGSYVLTDNGETRYWLNEFKGHDNYRKLGTQTLQFWITETELFRTQVGEGHELMTLVDPDDLGPSVMRLLQTIMHISGLGMVDDD